MERMVCELPPLSIHQSPTRPPELSGGLCRMGIQSGLCNGINGNTQAGGAQLCSLAQQRWRASLGVGVHVCVCVCVRVVVFASRALEASIAYVYECVHVCMLRWLMGVGVWACAHSHRVEAFLLIRARVSKCQMTDTHMYFSSAVEGLRRQWCETLRRWSGDGCRSLPNAWARYLGAAAMFHLGDSAPTQPHFLYLHAHLYLPTAGRWLKSSVLQCSNSLCKIESWLWADVNHNNLARTLHSLVERKLKNYQLVGGLGGVRGCFSDGHTKGRTQTEG